MHFCFSQGDVFRGNAYQICLERNKTPACLEGKQAGVNIARQMCRELNSTDRPEIIFFIIAEHPVYHRGLGVQLHRCNH